MDGVAKEDQVHFRIFVKMEIPDDDQSRVQFRLAVPSALIALGFLDPTDRDVSNRSTPLCESAYLCVVPSS